jgi:sorting nexin-13
MEGMHWVLLTLAMAVVSMGMVGIAKAICAIASFLAGGIFLIYGLSTSSQLTQRASIWFARRVDEKDVKIPCQSRMPDTSAPNGEGLHTELTGSPIIDEQLNQIIGYIFRDYVYTWHFNVTHSSAFPSEAEDSLHIVVANLAFKIKEVDLIPFLTTRLVDDVASHVRLFKQARAALRNMENQSVTNENCKLVDLESLFFDAEVSMEETVTCRDQVSSSQQDELLYLQNVAETLLFLLLPEYDFNSIPVRTLLREILVNMVLKPLLELISDPDSINQSLVWAVAGNDAPDDYRLKHDVFTSSIRYSDSLEELQATREMVNEEISCLRSNDSKGGSEQKQQLNSLLYLRKVIDARIHVLQSGAIDSDSISGLIAGSHFGSNVDWNQMIGPGLKLFSLPIEVIMKNNIAIGYFIDYMSFLGCASYVYFYLNIEGWKVSMEQNIQAIQLNSLQQHQPDTNESKQDLKLLAQLNNQQKSLMENMREAAHSIYEEYLSEKANPRLKLDESILKRLLFKIRTEPPNSEWFDEVQVRLGSHGN